MDHTLSFKDLIANIAKDWPAYRAQQTRDRQHDADKNVLKTFPAIIEAWVNSLDPNIYTINPSFLTYEGSAGRGNISKAPWVAAFDTRNTNSAQYGLYPVFLFSGDLQKLYLNIGLGTTQFTQAYGDNKKAKEKIRQSVALIRSIFKDNPLKPKNIIEDELNLKAEKNDKRLRGYEVGSIFSFKAYNVNNIDEAQVKSDFLSLLQFYQSMVQDPLLPSADALILRDAPEQKTTTTYKKFNPKDYTKKGSVGFAPKNSKEIGDIGEAYVYQCERERLIASGRKDLADNIIQHYKDLDYCGWDITSYDEQGNKIFIEVKSTTGSSFFGFIMSPNEWSKANDPKIAERYKIYRVLNALSQSPEIHVIDNIKELISTNKLEAKPTGYKIGN